MGTVVAIEDKKAYRAELERCEGVLGSIADYVFTMGVNLAALGPWKDWNGTQEPGAKMEFTFEALSQTGDNRVTAVMKVYEAARVAQEQLRGPKPKEH